jgi:hypothetical protein
VTETLELVDRLGGPAAHAEPSGGHCEGRLEAVLFGRAIGWVWRPEQPGERVSVRVIVDGEPVARGIADLHRLNLVNDGIGDGTHGFEVTLPHMLADGGRHTIEVLVGTEQSHLVVSNGFRGGVETADHAFAETVFTPVHRSNAADPAPDQRALLGKDGWLFLCQDRSRTLDQLSGVRTLSDEDVVAHVEALEERRDALRARGLPYVFALAPLKERVYAEMLPDGLAVSERGRPARRLIRALRDVEGCELFDLLPAMLDAKRHGQLYHRTDTHWNDRGALFAVRALLKELAKQRSSVHWPALEQLDALVSRPGFGGDLAGKPKVTLLGAELLELVDNGNWSEDVDELEPARLRAKPVEPGQHLMVSATRPPQAFERPGASLGRCVLVGDSFSLALLPWLAEQFSRLAFMWTPEPPLEAIAREEPDVVLHVKAERFLIARPGAVAQASAGH